MRTLSSFLFSGKWDRSIYMDVKKLHLCEAPQVSLFLLMHFLMARNNVAYTYMYIYVYYILYFRACRTSEALFQISKPAPIQSPCFGLDRLYLQECSGRICLWKKGRRKRTGRELALSDAFSIFYHRSVVHFVGAAIIRIQTLLRELYHSSTRTLNKK